jgi:type II secretion system protein H
VPPRNGYTLIELLLVLAIIVIAAAAAAPSLRRTARNMAVKSAANEVRAGLTRAHVQAMKTGRIHAFQYEVEGTKYKIEPWIGDDDALESKDGDSNNFVAASHNQSAPREPTLPEETKFALGDSTTSSRSQRIEQELTSSGGSGVNWSRPILFYPDGSAADAFVVVANNYQVGIRVDLRGMTSAVRVGELSDLRKLEQEAVSPR